MAKEVKKPSKKTPVKAKPAKKQVKAKAKNQAKSRKPLASSFWLTRHAVMVIKRHWRILGGVFLVYLVLNVLLASALSNISSAFSSVKTSLAVNGSNFWHATGGFASLFSSSGSSGSASGSVMSSVLFVLESLAIIWTLRHILSGQTVAVKQAYYKSTTPLIPFLLVLGVILIQLLPITIGASVLATVSTSVLTGNAIAVGVTWIVFGLLAAWSVYMVSASIFALYIVTLPGTEPLQALRAASDLARFRRLNIIRKLTFLPLLIFIVMAIVVVPLILYAKALVPAAFYVLSMAAILFGHTYLYGLYREMIE